MLAFSLGYFKEFDLNVINCYWRDIYLVKGVPEKPKPLRTISLFWLPRVILVLELRHLKNENNYK